MNIGAGLATRKQKTCTHVSTMTINSAGIERDICEKCGHVSFRFEDHQFEGADRDQFARPIDDQQKSFSH
jgi:hypothetical protein